MRRSPRSPHPPGTGGPRPVPGPAWLGTAVLAVAVVEVVLGVVALVTGPAWAGLLLLSSGLLVGTVSLGLRTTR